MPTQQDIQDMSSWMSVMEGAPAVHNPRVTSHMGQPGPAEIPQVDTIGAMKNVLHGLYDVLGEDLAQPVQVPPPVMNPQQTQYQMGWDENNWDEGVDLKVFQQSQQMTQNRPYTNYQPQPQTIQSMWEVVSEQYNGSKSLNNYTIRDSATKKAILSNILMKECAYSIANLINSGKTFDSPQVLGIISSGIQYTKEVKKVFEHLKQRGACLRESNYAGAASLDSKIQKNKDTATTIRNELVSYLNTNKISYK